MIPVISSLEWSKTAAESMTLGTDGPSSRVERKQTINSRKRYALCDLVFREEPLRINT